jgi:hypothetical protein
MDKHVVYENGKTLWGPLKLELKGQHTYCRNCSQYFNSTKAFDGHRRGKYVPINQGETRFCLTPDEMREKGFYLKPDGFWITSRMSAETSIARAGADNEENT